MAFSSTPKPRQGAPDRHAEVRRRRSVRSERRRTSEVAPVRASRVFRDFLAMHPDVENFTVQGIVEGIGQGGSATSLMLFSIPAMVRVPGTSDLVGPPTFAVASSFIGGRPLRLPAAILGRSVPRRALALAIHAVLPVLERAETLTRKRWSWLCTPAAQRIIGVLVFLLALPLAFPILGFGLPHATSLFTIALGMIEKDGVAVALGVTAGIASLVFFTAKGLTPQALVKKAADWIKRFVLQMTSVKKVAIAVLKRALHWCSAKLLSAPARRIEGGARNLGSHSKGLRLQPPASPGVFTTEIQPDSLIAA